MHRGINLLFRNKVAADENNEISVIIKERIRNLSRDVVREIAGNSLDQNNLDNLSMRAEQLYSHVERLVDNNIVHEVVLEHIGRAYSALQQVLQLSLRTQIGYETPEAEHVGPGRPACVIRREQLDYLRGHEFTGPRISKMLGVSISTVRGRMTVYGLRVGSTYSKISNQELDNKITTFLRTSPNSEYRTILGELRRQSHRIQSSRVRESVRRVDPEGVTRRWIQAVQRRRCSVYGPIALWHIDVNHKLIR